MQGWEIDWVGRTDWSGIRGCWEVGIGWSLAQTSKHAHTVNMLKCTANHHGSSHVPNSNELCFSWKDINYVPSPLLLPEPALTQCNQCSYFGPRASKGPTLARGGPTEWSHQLLSTPLFVPSLLRDGKKKCRLPNAIGLVMPPLSPARLQGNENEAVRTAGSKASRPLDCCAPSLHQPLDQWGEGTWATQGSFKGDDAQQVVAMLLAWPSHLCDVAADMEPVWAPALCRYPSDIWIRPHMVLT